jgi:ATP-dependent protease HslVU (ClpYQ) peptidase subunit
MTILIAVKKNGRVFLGADRITTFGNEYHTDLVGGEKIIKLKNAYLATSGYILLDNVIEHLVVTNHKMMENPFKTRADVFSFFLELYSELKKAYTLVDTGKDSYAGIYNVFFVVTPTSIYGVSNNMSVSEYPEYAAKGAGSDYSLGTLWALYDTIDDGYELVRMALESACHFSVYCKEPLDIVEVRAEDFKGPMKGYKAFGNKLKTMNKRRSPGNLIEAAKSNGRSTSAAKKAVKPVKKKR